MCAIIIIFDYFKNHFFILAKEDIVHTFTGVDWFEYSMKNNAIDSYRDQLLLRQVLF